MNWTSSVAAIRMFCLSSGARWGGLSAAVDWQILRQLSASCDYVNVAPSLRSICVRFFRPTKRLQPRIRHQRLACTFERLFGTLVAELERASKTNRESTPFVAVGKAWVISNRSGGRVTHKCTTVLI